MIEFVKKFIAKKLSLCDKTKNNNKLNTTHRHTTTTIIVMAKWQKNSYFVESIIVVFVLLYLHHKCESQINKISANICTYMYVFTVCGIETEDWTIIFFLGIILGFIFVIFIDYAFS